MNASYRGFTWNLTTAEMENVRRILSRYRSGQELSRWDDSIAKFLIAKIDLVMEVSPDGHSTTHGAADS